MSARGSIVLLLIGIIVEIVGAAFKLQHWPYAGSLLLGGSLIQIIAVLVIIHKLLRFPGAKEFLDS